MDMYLIAAIVTFLVDVAILGWVVVRYGWGYEK